MRPLIIALTCTLATGAACSKDRSSAPPPSTDQRSASAPPGQPPPQRATRKPVQIAMKNVRLWADDGIVLDVRELRGEMVSTVAGEPPVFDNQRSFILRVHAADVSMDMTSLTNLMNRHVFGYEHAPLGDITTEIDEGQLKMKATLHKGVPVPISMKADVEATPDGRMRLKTTKVSTLGVPAKKLMDLFGLELGDVVNLKERRGVEIDENDIIIAPGQILPPPEIQGHLSRVAIVNGRLQQTFVPAAGVSPAKLSPPEPNNNYVYFSGSDIRFGKLLMSDADLELIDADPKDPFDFFPSRYMSQLVAGYSKSTSSGGLKTYVPDYADLNRVKDLRPGK
jgi:hypothetical protein